MSAVKRSADGHWRFHWTPQGYEVQAPADVPEDVVGWITGFLHSEIGGGPDAAAWLAEHWRDARAGTDNGIGGNGLFFWVDRDEVVVYDMQDRELARFPAEIMDLVVADFGRYRSGIAP